MAGMSWRRWCFLQCHIGVFGAHRLEDKTFKVMRRLVYWDDMKKDIDNWVNKCLTCIRHKKRPIKRESVPVKPVDGECWEEIMIDMEGPSAPPDKQGNAYTMTYMCCLCHQPLLEPLKCLTHAEVRRAFARCLFRSGTLPTLLRSDRGSEFRNALMTEFVALMGMRHRMGTQWRPMEQGMVERVHQEMQKILGLLLHDVIKCHPEEWTELFAAAR